MKLNKYSQFINEDKLRDNEYPESETLEFILICLIEWF